MPGRLLIFSPNWLGDAVMALPAMAAVRTAWPEARLAVAVRRPLAPLFESVPLVQAIVPLDSRSAYSDRMRAVADAERVRAGEFDTALLLPNSFASAWLARRAGIPERWGYRGDFRRLLLTNSMPRPSRRGHQSEYYQGLVECLTTGHGRRAAGQGPHNGPLLQPSSRILARARELLVARGWRENAPLVGLAPGAAYGHAKRWPPARFAAVLKALAAAGVQSVVVGSTGDVDAARELEQALGDEARSLGWIDLVGRTDLSTLLGILAACRAVVTNDSGAMHLAAALGIPVTVMFGPTNERTTAPLPIGGEPARAHAVLVKTAWCRPCMLRDCPIDHRCMTRITVDDVLEAVRKQLG
jgi:heptosyltransferase-2